MTEVTSTKFEVGKRYRARNGEIAGPLMWKEGSCYHLADAASGRTWTVDGRAALWTSENHPWDLLPGAIPDEPQPDAIYWQARAEKAEARLEKIHREFEALLTADTEWAICIKIICNRIGITIVPAQPLKVVWKDGE